DHDEQLVRDLPGGQPAQGEAAGLRPRAIRRGGRAHRHRGREAAGADLPAGDIERGAYGIRTRAAAVRGRCPRPLDECAGEVQCSRARKTRLPWNAAPKTEAERGYNAVALRGRLMVGRLTLDQVVKVRVLAPQLSTRS